MPGLNSFHTKVGNNLLNAKETMVITGKKIKQSSNPFLHGYNYKLKNQLFKLKK